MSHLFLGKPVPHPWQCYVTGKESVLRDCRKLASCSENARQKYGIWTGFWRVSRISVRQGLKEEMPGGMAEDTNT